MQLTFRRGQGHVELGAQSGHRLRCPRQSERLPDKHYQRTARRARTEGRIPLVHAPCSLLSALSPKRPGAATGTIASALEMARLARVLWATKDASGSGSATPVSDERNRPRSRSRRSGVCVDHCGSLGIEARLAEARAGGTVSVAA